MKKAIKALFAGFLSLTLLFSVFTTAVFTAAADEEEPMYIMFVDFENIGYWISQHGDSTLTRDSSRKTQGQYSMRSRLSPEATPRSDQILLLYEAMETTDLSAYDYFEFDMMLDKVDQFLSPKNELVMQLNVIDPDSGHSDGFNNLLVLKKDNAVPNQWLTMWSALTKTPVVPNTSITHISKLRIAFFNVTEPLAVHELNLNFDRLMFYNSAFKTAREEEQTRVAGLLEALTVPTAEDYQSLSAQILAAESAYKEMLANYPGAKISNQSKYDQVISQYYAFAKAGLIADAEELIRAIGEVTQANYLEKRDAITSAMQAIEALRILYGDEDVEISNGDDLISAMAKYDNIVAAESVITLIKALPETESLTADNADAVNAAKAAYDGLTPEQKEYVSVDEVAALDAAVRRIYDILHPYTPGDVDESGEVKAPDALLALQHSVSKITLEGNKLLAADVDGNGSVNATDALLILQYAVGKINQWPANR